MDQLKYSAMWSTRLRILCRLRLVRAFRGAAPPGANSPGNQRDSGIPLWRFRHPPPTACSRIDPKESARDAPLKASIDLSEVAACDGAANTVDTEPCLTLPAADAAR